jgi:hypothetical protein
MVFSVEVVQLDLMNPETFQYRVFNDEDKFVASFEDLEEANAFIVDNGGSPQSAILWKRGIQATAGSVFR